MPSRAGRTRFRPITSAPLTAGANAKRPAWAGCSKTKISSPTSSSVRQPPARTTAEIVAKRTGFKGSIHFTDRLYDSDVKEHCAVLAGVPSGPACILLVGHNPCLEELLLHLTGADEHLPTAAIARIDFAIDGWSELKRRTRGKLVTVWRPKELDD